MVSELKQSKAKDDVILIQDTLIASQSLKISELDNSISILSSQSEIKDSIISVKNEDIQNHKNKYEAEISKPKPKGWKKIMQSFLVGLLVGLVIN